MKRILKALILFIWLFTISNSSVWGQAKIKKGIKIGAELLNSLTANTGTFNNTVGYTFGLFTGINIHSQGNNSIIIKLELNYVNIQYFNADDKFYRVDKGRPEWNGEEYSVFDEHFQFGLLEIGFIPEYSFTVNENSRMGVFFGPSIGLGSRRVVLKKKDNVPLTSYPYFDYNMGFVMPISLNLGVTYYYSVFVLDVRFRYSYLTGSSGISDVTNLYAQVGFAL